ncbi:MAG: cytochrome c biogenesis protein [Syntrophobacterales bacterium]|nr:cytochrome c biogenesis protein [Syntrophobacterales bacterium]
MLIVLAFLCYFLGTAGYFICAYSRQPILPVVAWWFVVVGALFHALDLLASIFFPQYVGEFSLHSDALSIVSLLVAAIFALLARHRPISLMGTFIMPFVLLGIIGASVLPFEGVPMRPIFRHGMILFHIAMLFIAYAFFSLSFSISLVYLLQERKLKRKDLKTAMTLLFPSLEVLDRLNHRCVLIGFPFMTAGLIAGFGAAQVFWKKFWTGDPKEILSILTWCVYAILFHQRLALGWRGRKASIVAICGFISVIATFIGVNLYGETHHVTFFHHQEK